MRIIRLRNRLRQLFYRPHITRAHGFSMFDSRVRSTLDELDKAIEQKITPLLTGLWDD